MDTPLVSVITSAYKSAPYLANYLENITKQTIFSSVEIILVLNDVSDFEMRILSVYKEKYPLNIKTIYVCRENISTSTNRGYREAKGKYITYADVDDTRAINCLERQAEALDTHPEYDFAYGNFVIVPQQGETKGKFINAPGFDSQDFTRSSCVGPNHFFRKQLLNKIGYWDEQLRSGADFDFQVRAAFNCQFLKVAGDPLVYYSRYINSGSASSNINQPIERTVIELRYGSYDKTRLLMGYPYIASAVKNYRINQLFIDGKWYPVELYVPQYRQLMLSAKTSYFRLRSGYMVWRMSNMVKKPYRMLSAAIKSITC